MTYAIEAEGLTKRFGTTQALAGVDLAAREGTVLGVLGPNGAGKTTAVRVLATLLQADAGTGPAACSPSSGRGSSLRRRETNDCRLLAGSAGESSPQTAAPSVSAAPPRPGVSASWHK